MRYGRSAWGGRNAHAEGAVSPGATASFRRGRFMEISQADIVREIATLLKPFRKDATPITGETDIARDLNLDSLSMMDFIMELEEKFDVSIPLNLVPEIQTVADLAGTIHRIKKDA